MFGEIEILRIPDVRDAKDGLLSALRTGGSVDGALTLGQIVSLLQKVQEIEGVAKLMKSVEGTSIESGQLMEGNPLDQISVSDIRKLIEDLIERSLGEVGVGTFLLFARLILHHHLITFSAYRNLNRTKLV